MRPKQRPNKDDFGNPLKHNTVVWRRNEARNMIDRFLNWLKRLSDKNKLVYCRKSIPLVNFENAVFNHVIIYDNWDLVRFGYCDDCNDEQIIENECCIKCGNVLSTSKVKYRGLGYADFQHVEIARLDHVQRFFTTDKSFRHLSNSGDFSHMEICVVEE